MTMNGEHSARTERSALTGIADFLKRVLFYWSSRFEQADIIVANHDLLLSNRIISSDTLPEPDESLLVIDEAHHFWTKQESIKGRVWGWAGWLARSNRCQICLKPTISVPKRGG